MDDWEDRFRGPCGIQYGVWIPRDPNYVKTKDEQKAPEPPKIPTEDSIKFRVVDDQTGRAVPGVLLDIQVPGGFIETGHETRRDGLVESLGLPSGECEVSCDINDLTLKNTLVFVGTGDEPIEKASEGPKGTGIPDPEPGTRYRIVFVEKHKVRKEETLKDVARAAGIDWQALSDFNWGKGAPAEYYFQTTDLICIPKKWSQKGFMTNQQHTIRVKWDFFIEDDWKKRADDCIEPILYTYDPKLDNGRGEFRFVFEEGSLRCSHAIGESARVCDASSEKRTAVEEHHSFIYLDVGCWADNADGKGKRCRNFALVCGPHVYLCEFNHGQRAPRSRVDSVQKFFNEIIGQGYGVEVVKYACANTKKKKLEEDTQLYLFLGDLHLPPHKWEPKFHTLGDYVSSGISDALGDPDIFKEASYDLSEFLRAIKGLSNSTKKLLHFIQVGDMYELWLGESYLFKPGKDRPEWVRENAPYEVVEWVKDIEERNHVSADFRNLQHDNLAEVRFLWGNHDGYLQDPYVAKKSGIPERDGAFEGLHGEIFCEHGHRFDSKNFDNLKSSITAGPSLADWAYYLPSVRKLEDVLRPNMRESYLLGSSLLSLYQDHDQHHSFSIYIMGHTHTNYISRMEIYPRI